MTTQNLNRARIERLRKAGDEAIADVEARAHAIADEHDALDESERDIVRARQRRQQVERLLRQIELDNEAAINGNREVLEEEASQLDFILNGIEEPAPAEPTPVVVVEPAPAEPEPAPADPTPPPATQVVVVNADNQPDSTPRWKKVLGCPWVIGLALLAAIVMLVIMSRNYETILGWAAGDADWQQNGFVRFMLIVGPPLLVGYWVWIWAKSQFCDDQD